MVDAVGSVLLQGSALRSSPQVASVVSAASVSAVSPEADFITSGIVVDNLQNVAILEYRSSRTGKVVEQYPTEAQIEAFKNASELRDAAIRAAEAEAAQRSAAEHAAPAVQQQSGGGDHVAVVQAPAPAPVSAPAPQEASVPAPAPASTGSSNSTHSVLA